MFKSRTITTPSLNEYCCNVFSYHEHSDFKPCHDSLKLIILKLIQSMEAAIIFIYTKIKHKTIIIYWVVNLYSTKLYNYYTHLKNCKITPVIPFLNATLIVH